MGVPVFSLNFLTCLKQLRSDPELLKSLSRINYSGFTTLQNIMAFNKTNKVSVATLSVPVVGGQGRQHRIDGEGEVCLRKLKKTKYEREA